MGHELCLPGAFDQAAWYGCGPHETYVDRKVAQQKIFGPTLVRFKFCFSVTHFHGDFYFLFGLNFQFSVIQFVLRKKGIGYAPSICAASRNR